MENNRNHVLSLENRLLNGLNCEGVKYHRNGTAPFLPGLLSLAFDGFSGEAILHRMDLMGIAISTGSACDSVNTEISHVLEAIRFDESLAKGTIRISLSKENADDEVDAIISAIKKIVIAR